MKISFILPGIGIVGGIRVIFEYANRLIKHGHEVYIIYPAIFPKLMSKSSLIELTMKPILCFKNMIKYNKLNWFDLKAKLIKIPTMNPKFVNIVKNKIPNSDVIIATSWETAHFVNALPKDKGEKFYFVQHYEIWDIWNDPMCWKKVREIEKDTNKLPIAMSYVTPDDPRLKKFKELVDETYVMPLKKITISSWLKELLERRFNQKVYGVVPNGVNFNIFYCEKEKTWASQKKIILMPYRGIPWKGDIDGLNALKIIYNEFKDGIDIWFYGQNKPKNLPDWIKFFERPSDDELRKLYCMAHILVIPSWVEGFHLPPLEGMACKCALVVTNVGAVPDIITNGVNGVVVPPQNPQKLARGIIYLLDNWEEAKKMAERGYKFAKRFTWEKSVKQFEELILRNI